jgi:hypothetical protein
MILKVVSQLEQNMYELHKYCKDHLLMMYVQSGITIKDALTH